MEAEGEVFIKTSFAPERNTPQNDKVWRRTLADTVEAPLFAVQIMAIALYEPLADSQPRPER
jgi:hypothetical protein